MRRKIRISGYGKQVGEQIVTNDMIAEHVDTSDEWIVQRTGIKQRRVTAKSTAQMAGESLIAAVENAQITVEDLDILIVVSTSSEHIMPTTGGIIMKMLHMSKQIPVFELNSACTGFINGLEVATSLMETNDYKIAAVIGVEKYSQHIDWTDRSTCILFGDGAGAVILERAETSGSISKAYVANKPDTSNSLVLEANIHTNCPFVPKQEIVKNNYIEMKGQEVFKFAVNVIPQALDRTLAENDEVIDNIDYFVFHQANERILHYVAKKYDISVEKCFMNLDKYGNTGAASIPIALAEMEELGLLQPGVKLILVGFGGGLSWGTIFVEIGR